VEKSSRFSVVVFERDRPCRVRLVLAILAEAWAPHLFSRPTKKLILQYMIHFVLSVPEKASGRIGEVRRHGSGLGMGKATRKNCSTGPRVLAAARVRLGRVTRAWGRQSIRSRLEEGMQRSADCL
jgi:hypothetical protein